MAEYVNTSSASFVREYTNKIARGIDTTTNGLIEYYILNKVHNIPTIIYDNYDNVLYVIDGKVVYDHNINKESELEKKYTDQEVLKNCINIKYTKISAMGIPLGVQAAYYK
jgi:hypothetical protein